MPWIDRPAVRGEATVEALEGVARDALESTGCDDPPVDPFELADCLRIEVRANRRGGGRREGNVVYVDMRARHVRACGICAHEIAHVLLDRAREPNTEPGARYLSGALMLPRAAFDRDLRDTAWALDELRRRHPNASAEMIARRVVAMRDAVATIIDNGKVTARVVSPWLEDPRLRRTSRWERGLADAALDSGELVRGDQLVWALPVLDGSWRRVVIVAEASQLALRF